MSTPPARNIRQLTRAPAKDAACTPPSEKCNEEQEVLEETTKNDECDIEEFDTLDIGEKTIPILGDRRRPQSAKQEGDMISDFFSV